MSGNGRPERRAGPGGAAPAAAGRAARGWATLAGDLSAFRVYDLCQLLALSRATGTLFLRAPGVRGAILVADGAIVGVRARPHPERIGHLLAAGGAVAASALAPALAAQIGGDRRPLGVILVAAGALAPDALDQALTAQARATLAALLLLPAGRFAFAPGVLFPGAERLLVPDPQALLLDALARLDERTAGGTDSAAGR